MDLFINRESRYAHVDGCFYVSEREVEPANWAVVRGVTPEVWRAIETTPLTIAVGVAEASAERLCSHCGPKPVA